MRTALSANAEKMSALCPRLTTPHGRLAPRPLEQRAPPVRRRSRSKPRAPPHPPSAVLMAPLNRTPASLFSNCAAGPWGHPGSRARREAGESSAAATEKKWRAAAAAARRSRRQFCLFVVSGRRNTSSIACCVWPLEGTQSGCASKKKGKSKRGKACNQAAKTGGAEQAPPPGGSQEKGVECVHAYLFKVQ